MLRASLSNIILSEINIDKIKNIFGNTPILNMLFKLGSQALIDYEYPTHLFIEATRVCNLQCNYCPRNIAPSKSGHIDFGLFTKIIDEATGFGSRNFCLHMLGEPLLHPRIVEMAQYIKKADAHHSVLLTTNGYFLDELKAKEFLKCNLDKITFSLFSLKDERCKMLTGNGDVYRVIDNIKNMVALKKKDRSRTRIYIRFLVCDENEDEIQQFRSLAKKLGAILEIRYTHNYSGVIKKDYTSKNRIKKRYPCYHLWFSPAIAWDGKVLLCCSDWNNLEVLGDANKDSLSGIWQSERLKELRKLHLKGNYAGIPLCEKCNVWTLYPDIFLKSQKR